MPTQAKRAHVVLVPGCGGFDALGQLEYYSGLTPLFQRLQAGNAVLHYFDNFSTVAVSTCADRLRKFLANRFARGEIARSSQLVLVGHSTGGLDIRSPLWNLSGSQPRIPVDGSAEVDPQEILELVRLVVFLSVPHWGNNIADWLRSHGSFAKLWSPRCAPRSPVHNCRLLITCNERLRAGLPVSPALPCFSPSAIPSLRPTNTAVPGTSQKRTRRRPNSICTCATFASDFRAMDDLTSLPPADNSASPVHFSAEMRLKELNAWKDRGIEAPSYVTLGRRPFRFDPSLPAPVFDLTNPLTYPEVVKNASLAEGTDVVYRLCYRVCAGGPFQQPNLAATITRSLGPVASRNFAVWDNDGIVNTTSLLWPQGENVLVPADHMDIVGHYEPLPDVHGEGRVCRAYDLLGSASGFNDDLFEEIWTEIFSYCLGRRRPATHAADRRRALKSPAISQARLRPPAIHADCRLNRFLVPQLIFSLSCAKQATIRSNGNNPKHCS